MFGGHRDDKIYGNAGNDVLLYGDYGNDAVYGGTGNDNVIGSWGNDYLYGESGNDVIGFESTYDEIGDDYCDGGSGDDKIYSGTGNDTNYGGYGFDIIYADAGNDYVNGGHHSIYDYSFNYLYGEAGNDYMTRILRQCTKPFLIASKLFFWCQISFSLIVIPIKRLSPDISVLIGMSTNSQTNFWHPVGFTDLLFIATIYQAVNLKRLTLISLPVLRVVNHVIQHP